MAFSELRERLSDAAGINAETSKHDPSIAVPTRSRPVDEAALLRTRGAEMFQRWNHRSSLLRGILFKGTVDRAEPGVEPATNPVHHRNDRERDARSNQTILDCRCARVIGHKSANGFYHSPGLIGADEDPVKMGCDISGYYAWLLSK
jgi:hypothetical protein